MTAFDPKREAMVYAGKKDEATVQFLRAAQLDLTAAEKAELVVNDLTPE